MECLMCGKEKAEKGLLDLMYYEDPLCYKCRKEWKKEELHMLYEGFPLTSTYQYNDAYSDCLIQYKECFDEALYPVFLYEESKKLKKKYKGYVLCGMPSSKEKEKERGFSHIEKMFSVVDLPFISPFAKVDDVSQKGYGYEERKEMVHHIVLKEDISMYQKILLVDDVITTGSTLSGAIQCLLDSSHKIEIYTVAYSRKWLE